MKRLPLLAGVMACSTVFPGQLLAHAFPENSSPHVGATIEKSPSQVKIWFDAHLEPLFDELLVKNAKGIVVSSGKAHVDANNPALLEVSLHPDLPPGRYDVHWRVTARDGHRTEGNFTFTVRPRR